MSYSAMAHAMINYLEGHLDHFEMREMSDRFGFSDIYLRELFARHVGMPIMQYYRRRKLMVSAFEILHSDKNILDIALESGFSNHESYTRAFRRVFGMTPSCFRRERPRIAGRPLDTSVFGLELLVSNEKRRDVSMMEQSGDSAILYGIRKIRHGAYGSNTMFPICIKAVSEYLGDDVSFPFIMAATGAAFRMVWNKGAWDLSNIDIYHALRESHDIYKYGAKALGRDFSFLGREEKTKKEDFTAYIRSHIAKGFPVIALGIIGPPEPCIVAGYEAGGECVMGWNFFQDDPSFAVSTMDNGYFKCGNWWENTDTQAVMCIGGRAGDPCGDKEIIKRAIDIMEPRDESGYAKGIRAYGAWKTMILDEKWFDNGTVFDEMFSKLLVQEDAMTCIGDGRRWAAEYFEEISVRYGEDEKKLCYRIRDHFQKVSDIAGKMMALIGDWDDTENMLKNFADRSVREELGRLTDSAEQEDERAFEEIKALYKRI